MRLASISGGITVSVIAEAAICIQGTNEAFLERQIYRKSTNGGNASGLDAILGTLPRKCFCERDETHLRGTVVRLAKVAVQAGGAGGVDDTPELLLAEVWPGGFGARECAFEVHLRDLVPFFIGHILETKSPRMR